MGETRTLMRALAGERQAVPPVWIMRQAGRYLPEYRGVRDRAGDFLTLCDTPELAAEVTLQPVRRFGLDAAILFADILLLSRALGADLSFVAGEGPRLAPLTSRAEIARLRAVDEIADRLAPVFETVRLVRRELAGRIPLIGFAGAPWTVASYMIAGRGTPDQGPAHRLMAEEPEVFQELMEHLTEATFVYLSAQIEAGAEVVKLFDSWAGSLTGEAFTRYALGPVRRIVTSLKDRHPQVPVIVFPRGAGARYQGFAKATGADCIALDQSVDPTWAAAHVQSDGCVQGNLDPRHMVEGGPALAEQTRRIVAAFGGGPHVFNLGHGITPEADPDNVQRMLDAIRD